MNVSLISSSKGLLLRTTMAAGSLIAGLAYLVLAFAVFVGCAGHLGICFALVLCFDFERVARDEENL